MTLSAEGVGLVMKAALLTVVILVTALVRTAVGPSRRRHAVMVMGTIGGMAAGIAAAKPLSAFFGTDVSTLSALAGVFAGWAAAYPFIRHIPRNAA